MKHLSLGIVAFCVVIFFIQINIHGFTDRFVDYDMVQTMIALVSKDVLIRPWILVTSIFLHGGFEHLFYNMFALGLFGFILENLIGSKRFVIVFILSGIIAGMGSVFFYDAAIGASGAIFGIIGCLAALRPKMAIWVFGVPMPMFLAAILWAILDIVGIFMPTGTANVAHLMGLMCGVVFGLAWKKRFSEFKKKEVEILDDNEILKWEDEWM